MEACADLNAARRIVVYGGTQCFPQAGGIETMPVSRLMDELAAEAE